MMNHFRILKGMILDIEKEMRAAGDGDEPSLKAVIDRMRQIKGYAEEVEEEALSARFAIQQMQKDVQLQRRMNRPRYDPSQLPPEDVADDPSNHCGE
jgi:hypothetical protein